jgi:hypothetical protein
MLLTGSGSRLWNMLHAGGNRALIARAARVSTPLPVTRVVRNGESYTLYDRTGRKIGTIWYAECIPHLGRNEETLYLRRDS